MDGDVELAKQNARRLANAKPSRLRSTIARLKLKGIDGGFLQMVEHVVSFDDPRKTLLASTRCCMAVVSPCCEMCQQACVTDTTLSCSALSV